MPDIVQQVRPIAPGYSYPLRVRVTGSEPAFPAGCAIRAELRDHAGADRLAAAPSTAGGTIVRVDDETIQIEFSGEETARIGNDTAMLDLVRTDIEPEEWMGVQIQLPVVTPVTRPETGG